MVAAKTDKVTRVVWRISQAHPQGEFVQLSGRKLKHSIPAETQAPDFTASTLDLLCGVDVTETAMDTLPGDLIDAFIQSKRG